MDLTPSQESRQNGIETGRHETDCENDRVEPKDYQPMEEGWLASNADDRKTEQSKILETRKN
jgi:hypothetical protein